MPHPKVKISDNTGNTVDITGNALDVNIASGTADIDIGDVSLLLDGTAADYGTGNVNTSGRTLRVTLASDDYQFGEHDDAASQTGSINSKLRYIGNSTASNLAELETIDNSLNNIETYTGTVLNAISGNEMQVDIVSAPTLTVNGTVTSNLAIGGTALTFDNSTHNSLHVAISDGAGIAHVTGNNELEVYIADIDANAGALYTRPLIAAAATNGKVSVLNSSTEILDGAAGRLSYTIVNDSDEVIYLAIEDAAVLNEGIRLNPNGGSFSDTLATDKVFGICAVSGKNVTICEQFII